MTKISFAPDQKSAVMAAEPLWLQELPPKPGQLGSAISTAWEDPGPALFANKPFESLLIWNFRAEFVDYLRMRHSQIVFRVIKP